MVVVSGLRKAFGSVQAVRDISFTIAEGTFFSLLGPSGCGKSTTLRCIAGLEVPDGGTITIGDQVLVDAEAGRFVPASERRLGMVFQSYAIWPHMSVRENVFFPLRSAPRRRRPSAADAARRVAHALEVVRLSEVAERRATDLSGGQQQRLALARALALEPPLLLLDEPLSNLDARLREEVRVELQRVQREVGVTTLYVTHDQAEALSLSDTVALMRNGAIEQLGPPREVYRRPATGFVAAFIGAANLLPGTILREENGHVAVRTALGALLVPVDGCASHAGSAHVAVVVRPEHVLLDVAPSAVSTVVSSSFLGDIAEHVVTIGGGDTLRARGPAHTILEPGTPVTVTVDEKALALVAEGNGAHAAG